MFEKRNSGAMRNEINFTRNWNNKLTGQCFTSIRPKDESRFHIGDVFCIMLNRAPIAYAEINDIDSFLLHEVSESEARIDSAIGKQDFIQLFKNIYKNQNIDWSKRMVSKITFTKVKIHAAKSKSQPHSEEIPA
jgi:hypothetical protein